MECVFSFSRQAGDDRFNPRRVVSRCVAGEEPGRGSGGEGQVENERVGLISLWRLLSHKTCSDGMRRGRLGTFLIG